MVSARVRPKPTRYRHRAVFIRTTKRRPAVDGEMETVDDTVDEEITISQGRDDCAESDTTSTPTDPYTQPPMIPDHFTRAPLVRDGLVTDTSEDQDETAESCLAAAAGVRAANPVNRHGVPHLDRARHARFLHQSLGALPGTFLGYDASRPWILFWCLNGLWLLGEDVAPYRTRLVETARSMQNAGGGFGGGHGQASHLATTYAVVMALAVVGGDACYEAVDRRVLWKWLCALKQADGGFQMSVGGEEDVRWVADWQRDGQARNA